MAGSFEVHRYSIDTLRRVLAERAGAARHVVDAKIHSGYFESYFRTPQTATILIENEYVDRDFIEDFAAYYVRCFHPYERKCSRLHFFSREFTDNDFDALLRGQQGSLTEQVLRDAYLGFIVVKPLPQTFIGRTCLKTYPDDGGRRWYPITRRYEAHLYGMALPIETLAFQEQDHVTAACATSALWSAFHGTGKLFQHAIPSPVEITQAANAILPLEERSLPTHGLTVQQMAHAIRSVGLEPFVVNVRDEFVLRSTLYAYMRGRVPVLMIVTLADMSGASPQFLGKHAVAVTGYGLAATPASPTSSGFASQACCIDRIYAHDDQVGPFARMVLDGTTVPVLSNGQPCNLLSLSTSWKNAAGTLDKVRAIPETILVPLYHKIRIPFGAVQDAVIQFDRFLEILRSHGLLPCAQRLQWDVYLTDINTLKGDLASSQALQGEARREALLRSLPRFLWRATVFGDAKPVLDLLFDATDIEQGRCFVQALEYDPAVAGILRSIVSVPATQSSLQAMRSGRFWNGSSQQHLKRLARPQHGGRPNAWMSGVQIPSDDAVVSPIARGGLFRPPPHSGSSSTR